MLKIANKLESFPDIRLPLYSNDLTIWATKGSLAEKEEALQKATNWVEKAAGENELQCTTEKFEVIRIQNSCYVSPGKINIRLGKLIIPETDEIRVLGMFIQSNGKANFTIENMKKVNSADCKIVRRIT